LLSDRSRRLGCNKSAMMSDWAVEQGVSQRWRAGSDKARLAPALRRVRFPSRIKSARRASSKVKIGATHLCSIHHICSQVSSDTSFRAPYCATVKLIRARNSLVSLFVLDQVNHFTSHIDSINHAAETATF